MEQITSMDGTNIAYERSSSGPPLLLVHGTGTDHTYWDSIVPELGRCFTTYAVDRRGRGRSGDTEPYSLQREFEDVAATIESIPGPVSVLAHSYGSLCALEAALLTSRISRMVLYEPPVYTTVKISYPASILERFNGYLSTGDPEKALLMLYEAGHMPADELEALRSHPSWGARLSAARTIPREVISVRSYAFDPERFTGLSVPILFLLGGESIRFYKEATETLHVALPNSRISVLPGQEHEAAIISPVLVLQEAISFLTDDRNDR